ncbi:MAG: LTA synthase family protein [Lachnospiraceae bacterium]|nr:LTA synthase family protein [Lachnospiraceae bacterium]
MDGELKAQYRRMLGKQYALQLIIPVSLLWDELVFHAYINKGFSNASMGFLILFALGIGLTVAVITGRMGKKATIIVNCIVLAALTAWFVVQGVSHGMLQSYLTLALTDNAEEAAEFKGDVLTCLLRRTPLVLLLLVPVVVYIILLVRKTIPHEKVRGWIVTVTGLLAIECFLIAAIALTSDHCRDNGQYDMFVKDWENDRGVTNMGVIVGFFQDVRVRLTYDPQDVGEITNVTIPSLMPVMPTKPVATATPTMTPTPGPTQAPEDTPTPTPSPSPSPTPVDRSPHMLNIDFQALADAETDKTIKTIHQYYAGEKATNKNEYTGLCKGYNLIVITAESFCPLAVDEELTPTLYKLVNNGFVFENFYTPKWQNNTTDSEYIVCTGLLPDTKDAKSFAKSAENSEPLALPPMFKALGYTARAFHNHDNTYYDRDKTHPNLGYEYFAVDSGLEITKQSHESDLEMMEAAIPMFINDDHFLAYFMTMSGHSPYSWSNAMCKKNREYVDDLPYTEAGKAYLACNIELDRALGYLIDELSKADKLYNTLIVMTGDHYPYALTEDELNDLAGHKIDKEFERYANHCVIWSAAFEQNVYIDKACCSLDLMPTVLNLMGVEYDSRLYMGHDMLSEEPGFVQFRNGSIITDYIRYSASTGKTEWLVDVDLSDADKKAYVESCKNLAKTKLNIARAVLNNDYYKYIQHLLPWVPITRN